MDKEYYEKIVRKAWDEVHRADPIKQRMYDALLRREAQGSAGDSARYAEVNKREATE